MQSDSEGIKNKYKCFMINLSDLYYCHIILG